VGYELAPVEVVSHDELVVGLKVRNHQTNEDRTVETDGIFVAIGHHPNTGFLQGQRMWEERGKCNKLFLCQIIDIRYPRSVG